MDAVDGKITMCPTCGTRTKPQIIGWPRLVTAFLLGIAVGVNIATIKLATTLFEF